MAIVGLAGETETGDVDDLSALADNAEHYGVYYHVDAAYGDNLITPFKRIQQALVVFLPFSLLQSRRSFSNSW